VCIRAERAAAVRDHLSVAGDLVEAALELLDWDRQRAVDVAGIELLGGPDVDEHHVAVGHTGEQLVAADRLDLVPEEVARGSLHLRQLRCRHLAQGEPEGEHVVTGQRVAHAQAVTSARHQTGGVQRLEVLGGVRARLTARGCELVNAPRALRQQVDQLQAPRARERLTHHRDRLEQHRLGSKRRHVAIQANN
jgi:hypothetical protein